MDMTLASSRGRSRPIRVVLALVLIALLIVAVVAASAVLSRPRPVALPFGPAANGALFYTADGDVVRLDSPTGTPAAIIRDTTYDVVLPSRDGSSLVLVGPGSGGAQIAVADVDGQHLTTLQGVYPGFSEIDWAPSGRELAIISEKDGARALTILAADGTGARALNLGLEPDGFWYLPDGRILFKGTHHGLGGPTFGLFIVDPAKGKLTTVSGLGPDEGAIAEAAPSPDGRTIIYHATGGANESGRLRLMDIDGSNDRALGVDEPGEEFADQSASFSPDGSQVLFTRFTAPGTTLTLVSAAGGPARAIGEMVPGNDMAVASYSPDGRSIIAYYPNGHLWLLDATGTGEDVRLDLPATDMPTWQRVAG